MLTFPSTVISNTTFKTHSKKKMLYASTSGANDKATFREPGGSSGYQPPSGKVFIALAVRVVHSNITAGDDPGIGQSSNDLTNTGSSTSPTDFQRHFCFKNESGWTGSGVIKISTISLFYPGKYVTLDARHSAGATQVNVWGLELSESEVFGIEGDSVGIDGTTFVDFSPEKLISLSADTTSTSSQNYATFRKADSASGYQVPVGKKLVVLCAVITRQGISGSGTFPGIGPGDNDVGFNSAGAPTNFVRQIFQVGESAFAGSGRDEYSIFGEIQAEKYPAFYGPAGAGRAKCQLIGLELDA